VAVLVKITNHGIRKPAYDEIAKQLIPALQQQPGFRFHFSCAEGDELAVNEIWDSAEQQRAWFDSSVRPNLPSDHTPKVEVTELYSTAGP
jgi:heme-degrading monooxygenase HmoA